MLIGTTLFVTVLMRMCLCLYVDERHAIYHENEQEKVAPGDVVVKVDVDTAEPLGHVEDCFIGFTIDSSQFSGHFNNVNFRLFSI